MKIIKLSILAVGLAAFVVACGGSTTNTTTTNTPATNANAQKANASTTPAATPDELAAAKKIYTEKCVGCHKENGTGGEKDIEGVKIKVPDFTSEKLKSEPDQEFIDAITNGYKEDGMPAFKGKISDQEIKDLVKLIRKEFQKK